MSSNLVSDRRASRAGREFPTRGSFGSANLALARAGRPPGIKVNAFALFLAAVIAFLTTAGPLAAEGPAARLDLNRATAAELEALPGIGEVKAAAILAVRDAQGGFASLDELERVRGIGPALAAKLRPLLEVGSAEVGRPSPARSGSGAAKANAQAASGKTATKAKKLPR